MSERPIIFSAPMIRALLAGRKSQTRRVLKPQPYPLEGRPGFWNASGAVCGRICISDADLLRLHRYVAGDRLWVKEAWRTVAGMDADAPARIGREAVEAGYSRPWAPISFEADGARLNWSAWEPLVEPGRLRSPIHMPRWASRLTLVVTDVKVERLQDISEEDAEAEGVQHEEGRFWRDYLMPGTQLALSARESFGTLWNSLHGPNAWAANPWVAAISFTVEQCNIDAEPREVAA